MAPKAPDLLPVVIPAISSPPFTCQGEGLLCSGYERALLEQLKGFVSGKRAKNAPNHPKDWWQAQLQLYGLDPGFSSTTIAVLKKRLKDELGKGLQEPSKEVCALEKKLNTQFIKANAEARNSKRGSTGTEIERKKEESNDEGGRKAKRQKEADVKPAPVQGKSKFQDVVGEWSVKSSEITEMWPQCGEDFRMSIFFHTLEERDASSEDDEKEFPRPKKKKHGADNALTKLEMLWANFDLGIYNGVLNVNGKFPNSPSIPSRPIPFLWRGREAGENEIQVDYDGSVNKGMISFLSPTIMEGEFKSSLGNFKFQGKRTSKTPGNKNAEEWHNLSERMWNKESVGRWH